MTTAKIDLKRTLSDLYKAGPRPVLLDVPRLSYLMVDGHGDPNTSAEFRDATAALYSLAYTIKFTLKRGGVIDYGVMPLEGLWWVADMALFSVHDKAMWDWTLMILQPDEVTPEVFADAREKVAAKVPAAALGRARLGTMIEGRCAQVLHRGPYSTEGPTVAALHAFITGQGLRLAGKHHEIYLNDPRRTSPENVKTIIRQPVR